MESVCKNALAIFLVVSVTFITASVVRRDSDDELLHRNTRAATSCRLPNGKTIENGHNFTRSDTGPCVFYVCRDGQVFPLEYQCFRNGNCYPLGDVYKLGCIERTCQLVSGYFDYAITKEACTGRDQRSCIAVGSTYKDGCFTYACEKEQESATSVSYHLKQVDFGCEYNGQCISENQTVTRGCRTMQCQKRFSAVGFYTIKDGCDINGECVDVGSSIQQSCRTLTCREENLNGIRILNIVPTKIQCKDSDNVCHDSGDYFPIEVDHQVANCTCQVQGFNIEYSCPSPNMQG